MYGTRLAWPNAQINANNIDIHFYRTGGDIPSLVLCHGAGDDGGCWAMTAENLRANYDVIMPDSRGHGLSSIGHGDYSPKTRTDDLEALVDALRLERPIIGGHSMGAESALLLAIRRPKEIRALILEDPVLVVPGDTVFGGWFGRSFQRSPGAYLSLLKTMKNLPSGLGLGITRLMNPGFPKSTAAPWFESKKRLSDDARKTMVWVFADWNSGYELLDQVSVPTLLIVGNRKKGSIVSLDEARAHAKGNPRIEIAEFPGADHNIRRADFPRYISVIRDFLKKVEIDEPNGAFSPHMERR